MKKDGTKKSRKPAKPAKGASAKPTAPKKEKGSKRLEEILSGTAKPAPAPPAETKKRAKKDRVLSKKEIVEERIETAAEKEKREEAVEKMEVFDRPIAKHGADEVLSAHGTATAKEVEDARVESPSYKVGDVLSRPGKENNKVVVRKVDRGLVRLRSEYGPKLTPWFLGSALRANGYEVVGKSTATASEKKPRVPGEPGRRGVAGPKLDVEPGTVLKRTFRGVEHVVKALADGKLSWKGQHFTSLSAVARAIRGTRRGNGPRFFGLR